MRVRIFLIIVLTCIYHSPLSAQGGKAGLSFLKLGVGARPLAMGEAGVATSYDPSATHYNPAGLHSSTTPQLLVMHKEWLEGTQTEFLAASFSVEPLSFGAFLNATSIPDFEIRQRPGPAEGTFTAHNAAVGISAAYDISESVYVGFSLKYLYEKIFVDEADGVGFDVGGLYRSPWGIDLGVSLANIGSMGKLRNESSTLPTTLRIGAARSEALASFDASMNFALDVVSVLPEDNTHIHLGAEFTYDQTFSIRAGYITGYETRNFTGGAGIRYTFLSVDYAFVPFSLGFGAAHTFSLTIDF